MTVTILELKTPDKPAFSDRLPLWTTAISYAVSYLFIAMTQTVVVATLRVPAKDKCKKGE